MDRRFILKTGAVSAAAFALQPSVTHAAKRQRLSLVTSWSPRMPLLQEAADRFAEGVREATAGRLDIKVFAGGELIPPLAVFDAVSAGDVALGVSAPYYWTGKLPAAAFFCAIPFGFDTTLTESWLASEGNELWRELYAPHNLIPFSLGNTGPQLAGWFKRPLTSPEDLKGLKIRMPGLGGKVLAKAGANVVLMPGGEIFTALDRGTIDATEWISPLHDERLGLHRAAKYCYYPGWQEPSANLELMIHSAVWNAWPADVKKIIECVAGEVARWSMAHTTKANADALNRLVHDHGVTVAALPPAILDTLKRHSAVMLEELAASDAQAKRILDSYHSYAQRVAAWHQICLQSSSFTLAVASKT